MSEKYRTTVTFSLFLLKNDFFFFPLLVIPMGKYQTQSSNKACQRDTLYFKIQMIDYCNLINIFESYLMTLIMENRVVIQ